MITREHQDIRTSVGPKVGAKPDRTVWWVALAATIASVCAYTYFASKGLALGYKDSISHLQIAARTLNSPTAGFAQLGGVWLPLPHILMLPLIWFTPFYYSGFAGSAVSMVSYVVACVYVYKCAFGLTRSRIPALAGLAVFALNPNVLYMQSTPMTELLLFAAIAATTYYVQRWIQTEEHRDKYPYLFAAAIAAFIACLTRYEAWPLTLVMGVIVAVVAWRQYGRPAMTGIALGFAFMAGAAIVLWLGWNLLIFGDPLNFQNGKYAKPSLWVGEGEVAVGHPTVAAETYWYAVVENLGIAVVLAMIAGVVALIAVRRSLDILPVLGLLTIAPFFVFALTVGQRPLHVMQITGDLYNVRFGLLMALPAAIFVCLPDQPTAVASLDCRAGSCDRLHVASLDAGRPDTHRHRAGGQRRVPPHRARHERFPPRALRRRSNPDRVLRKRVHTVRRTNSTVQQCL